MKKRDSKFELLRIISMLFIILSHYSLKTNWGEYKGTWGTDFYQPFGQIGVDLFVMISGYFLSMRYENLQKMLSKDVRLWFKVLFYSWLLLVIIFLISPSSIGHYELLLSIFPVTLNQYWFITSFMILMLLVPMLNDFIKKSTLSELFILFIAILGTSSIQTILPLKFTPFGESLNIGIMIASYLFAAIIRKYNITLHPFIIIIFFLSGLSLEYIGMIYFHCFVFTNGIGPFLSAVAIFYFTVHCRSFYSPIVNYFAASIFACYLVLCNVFSDKFLWNVILNIKQYGAHPIFPGLLICMVLITVVVFLDKIYIFFENNFLSNLFKKIDSFLVKKIGASSENIKS